MVYNAHSRFDKNISRKCACSTISDDLPKRNWSQSQMLRSKHHTALPVTANNRSRELSLGHPRQQAQGHTSTGAYSYVTTEVPNSRNRNITQKTGNKSKDAAREVCVIFVHCGVHVNNSKMNPAASNRDNRGTRPTQNRIVCSEGVSTQHRR